MRGVVCIRDCVIIRAHVCVCVHVRVHACVRDARVRARGHMCEHASVYVCLCARSCMCMC